MSVSQGCLHCVLHTLHDIMHCVLNLLCCLQGALGVNTSLFAFFFVVFNFLATATTPMIAAAVSASDTKQAAEVTYQATGMAVVLGTAVTIGLMSHADLVLNWMGLDDSQKAMFDVAKDYLLFRYVPWKCGPSAQFTMLELGCLQLIPTGCFKKTCESRL